jgi:soluble cytochrome b562
MIRLRSFIPGLAVLFYLGVVVAAKAATPLETAMKHMSNAYKALAFDLQQPDDANKANYLSLAAILKTEAHTSRGLVPQKAAALPADQQAAMVQAYQKSMDNLGRWIDSLTQAIQNGQWDAARQAMAAIKQQMVDGHKDFRIKE